MTKILATLATGMVFATIVRCVRTGCDNHSNVAKRYQQSINAKPVGKPVDA